eukprot:TRINITY_DN2815_c0_g1_i3.p1 TRINITY_DN2815_c0_g1~~TRINITY_DN2815_c0_g1_i3.p1  ORF type:complete len:245 (+),score=56.94 TRINITY_DN2815_c0_g1_i3:145-879(+)
MNKRIKILVSVSAALPIPESDPRLRRTVFNFRGNVDTAHFLGKLFRVLNQVLGLGQGGNEDEQRESSSRGEPLPLEGPSRASPPPTRPRSRTPKKNKRRRSSKRGNHPTEGSNESFVLPPTRLVDPLSRYKPRRSHLPPSPPPPSPLEPLPGYYSLWKSSQRALRLMTLTFLEHFPKHQFDSNIESQRILVSLMEMMSSEDDSSESHPTKWTCTLAMLLLFLKDRMKGSLGTSSRRSRRRLLHH